MNLCKGKKKFKVRYDRILICILGFLLIGYIGYKYVNRNLENIYITGNKYLSDQTIIEIAKLLMDYASKINNKIIPDINYKTSVEMKAFLSLRNA